MTNSSLHTCTRVLIRWVATRELHNAASSVRPGRQGRVYETGTFEQRPKALAGVDYSAIRQSTVKEKQKQMHQAGNPSAEERTCGQLHEFLSLLNFPFRATYLGHRADR